ncbi:dTMP kinase [Williamsia deligens]|uniref:Thymidylate kinase n=1 Tax=Williamsia deligens TaxID=321325 RepID=A0ABW3G1E1_9NOCA|nr:dTMP kinase [Williamsia deligens]MCP2194791.1 dTMP kinase [Williamsia deligens]
MGTLIVVEGLDGAGKRTMADTLTTRWEADGRTVATMAFPRYGESVHADIASEALHGEHGDLRSSAYAMAMLFALDRRDAADAIRDLLATHDVVLLDRYVASNAAYTAARLGESADGDAVEWVARLEFDRFALPVPDRQILLGTDPELARARATSRAADDESRALDAYERDTALQHATFAVYRDLVARSWRSPWTAISDSDDAVLHTLV